MCGDSSPESKVFGDIAEDIPICIAPIRGLWCARMHFTRKGILFMSSNPGQQFPAVIVTDVYDPDKQVGGFSGGGAATLQADAEACATKSLVTITFDPNADPVSG